jgi:REP element-mobilizing transposase RayT
MSHTSGNILLHLIFSAQGRLPLIKPDFRADLFAYLGGIVREMHGTALIINGTADHVHMLVRVRPAHSAAGHKGQFITLGPRKMGSEICVADRIWSV